jgi:hypothetical protein
MLGAVTVLMILLHVPGDSEIAEKRSEDEEYDSDG